MSPQAVPRFLFPNSYFFTESTLPNNKHPWFELFHDQVRSNVHDPRSQALIDYPIGFEELAGYLEEERRRLWKDCKEVYDRIKADKVKALMDRNVGMFYFMLTLDFFFANRFLAASLRSSSSLNISSSADGGSHDLMDDPSSLVPFFVESSQGIFFYFL
jgi:hypothetical protein